MSRPLFLFLRDPNGPWRFTSVQRDPTSAVVSGGVAAVAGAVSGGVAAIGSAVSGGVGALGSVVSGGVGALGSVVSGGVGALTGAVSGGVQHGLEGRRPVSGLLELSHEEARLLERIADHLAATPLTEVVVIGPSVGGGRKGGKAPKVKG